MTTTQITDPLTLAVSRLASADDHNESARQARALDTPEAHRLAGRFREQERLDLQRARVLAEISQAQALDSIAESLSRIALSR